jgi:anaerobic magnesium-protoporphyrin IX monomethyl ester cyclase
LAQGFDLIGISLLTNYYNHAVQLTNRFRQDLKAPIIWGGVHPTVLPEESLEHADMICIGEAEIPMLEAMKCLTEGKDLRDIDGIWMRGESRPEIAPLVDDLDSLPFMDLDFDDQFVLHPDGKAIVPLTDDLFVHYASTRALWDTDDMFFQVISTRGCPYSCSFCINRFTKKLYKGQKMLRRRSFDNLFQELEQVTRRFPIKLLMISDDSFFACKEEEIEGFAARYKDTIGIPFRCLATPNAVTDRKVKALVDAGMCWLEVGVQSCSTETLAMYRRQWGGVEQVTRAAHILSPYMDKIEVFFDLIIDNPWESKEQTAETLRAIVELPRPYKLQLFSLTLFPGTELYDRGTAEGLIHDPGEDIYNKHYLSRDYSYFGLMLSLIYRNFPRGLLRILLSKPMVAVFQHNIFKPIIKSMFGVVRLLKLAKYQLIGRPEVIPDRS